MNREEMFKDISIMGRVVYIIFAIDTYLRESAEYKKWDRLLEALWSYPEYYCCVDDYAYMLVECTPETVLDERDDLKDFEHFSEAELLKLKALYAGSHCTDTVNYLMTQMNEILAHNLYTTVAPPEDFSLKVICELYPYIEKLLGEKTPAVKPLEKYSIYEQDCWGDFSVGI